MKRLRSLDKRLLTILLIVFVQMFGASLVLPILPRVAQNDFGLRPELVALLVSSFFVAQFVAGPWIGRLSDTYGRIPVLLISQVGTVISFLMLGVAQSAWILFASRILDGITGGNIIAAQAYITDVTPRERRTEALGYVMAAFGLGFIFGPALGGFVSAAFAPATAFYMAAAAAAIVVALTYFTLDETLTPEQRRENVRVSKNGMSLRQVTQNGTLMLVLGIAFIGQFALGIVQATFALYGEAVLFAGATNSVTSLGIGLLLSVVGITQFTVQSFGLRPLLRRFGEVKLIILGSVSRAVGLFIFALVLSPWLAGFGSFFFALGMAIMMPPLQSLATTTVPDQMRGSVLGVYQSAISLSTIVSTAIGGVIFDIGPTMPYWVAGVLALVVIFPVFTLPGRNKTIPIPTKH